MSPKKARNWQNCLLNCATTFQIIEKQVANENVSNFYKHSSLIIWSQKNVLTLAYYILHFFKKNYDKRKWNVFYMFRNNNNWEICLSRFVLNLYFTWSAIRIYLLVYRIVNANGYLIIWNFEAVLDYIANRMLMTCFEINLKILTFKWSIFCHPSLQVQF